MLKSPGLHGLCQFQLATVTAKEKLPDQPPQKTFIPSWPMLGKISTERTSAKRSIPQARDILVSNNNAESCGAHLIYLFINEQ